MIYLIRHTTPDVEPGVCYGQSDLALAASFNDELAAVEKKLRLSPDMTVLSSPLQRCRKLALALFPDSHINVDERLLEMSFGDWEMQCWDEMNQDLLKHWGDHFVSMPAPNGESFECLSGRVLACWNGLDLLNQDYVIVTHAGVIRAILSVLLGSPLEKIFNLDVRYGDVISVKMFDQDSCRVRFV